MTEFKRETRYIVFKVKSLAPDDLEKLRDIADGYRMPECVVVEKDWSIYESVWALVEMEWNKRHTGGE